ncbi:hypothetical protein SLS62_005590 [Diatrype stigma]|uniref:Uncharacterized protein n=1 Tax=Diatrype stigma TaxID=117547 RepID=A0AAN9USD0_9PEZI
MERIVCTCKNCGCTWGKLVNLWIQVGKGYIGPTIQDEETSRLDIVPTGEVRLGEAQTLVDKWYGFVPVLSSRTLKLRLASGRESNINNDYVRSSGDTDGGSTRKPTRKDNAAPSLHDELQFSRLATDLEAQGEDIQRIDSAGHEAVSAFNNAIKRIEEEIARCNGNIFQIRQDLQGGTSRINGLEKGMSSLKDQVGELDQSAQHAIAFNHIEDAVRSAQRAITNVREDLTSDVQKSSRLMQEERNAWKSELDTTRNDMENLRRELSDAKDIARESASTAKAYEDDMVSLRAEVGRLREELSHGPPQKGSYSNGMFPSREIDVLTSNITRISQRASQVETLQMEFELLKGRVQRMESQKEADRVDVPKEQQQRVPASSADSQKRKWSSTIPEQNFTASNGSSAYSWTKAPAMSNWPSSSPGTYESLTSPPSAGTQATNSDASSSQRLTKSGAVDKRFLRRTKHSTLTQRSPKG